MPQPMFVFMLNSFLELYTKNSVLRGILPIEFVTTKPGEHCPHIDKIVRVCCLLYNVCESVVPFN